MHTHETDNPLLQSCTHLKKVGPSINTKLAKCHIHCVQDLLFYLPYRYQDRTHVSIIAELNVGDYAVIEGYVRYADYKEGPRRSFVCQISDGTGMLTLRFFHFHPNQAERFMIGRRIRCFGEVRHYTGFDMVHPEYWFCENDQAAKMDQHLTPIYSTTVGLSQSIIRLLIAETLRYLNYLPDYLPEEIRRDHYLMPLHEAILYLHQPPPDAPIHLLEQKQHDAQRRLIFEELVAHQLSMLQVREACRAYNSIPYLVSGRVEQALKEGLSFPLTKAQERVIKEIKQDLAKDQAMLRLLQGDVGAGKTVVAALVASVVLEAEAQVAVMAPTEILAEQHFRSFEQWFSPLGIKTVFLSGKSKAKERREILSILRTNLPLVIVGTHALFQKEVEFYYLGLVIIDEQHRFGVHQRMALRDKGRHSQSMPHQLIMTATPIPRTLAMTAYADLDVSIIDELPPGRTPIKTVAISNLRRDEVIARIKVACESKRQIYWVCTLIEESEVLQCKAAEVTAELLTHELAGVRIGLIHGRLKSSEKEAIMLAFKEHEIDLLVATTVIEVGVDVPNASLMIIENAERLGLAQLHQLRGRVGRGVQQSYCVLLYQEPLSLIGRERLHVMRQTQDGFEIAHQDLQLRGPGEVLGTRQTGLMQLHIADLIRDQELLPTIQRAAKQILGADPKAAKCLIERWISKDLSYSQV